MLSNCLNQYWNQRVDLLLTGFGYVATVTECLSSLLFGIVGICFLHVIGYFQQQHAFYQKGEAPETTANDEDIVGDISNEE